MAGDYTIWHNPKCSTSRFVLEALRAGGVQPLVRDYQKDPPSADELRAALKVLDIAPRDLLRSKDATPEERALEGEALIAALAREPRLIERPVVFSPKGSAVMRPKEMVFDLLPAGTGA